MKNKEFRMLQLFAAETGTTTAADLAPAISVDFTSRIAQNIVELQQDRKSTRLNSSHKTESRMPSSA